MNSARTHFLPFTADYISIILYNPEGINQGCLQQRAYHIQETYSYRVLYLLYFRDDILVLYGCSTWTLRQEHYAKLRTVHHRVLLRIIGAQRKRPDHRMTSYNRALEITGCESIETTLRTRRLLWAGTLLRMSGGRRAAAEANRFRKP